MYDCVRDNTNVRASANTSFLTLLDNGGRRAVNDQAAMGYDYNETFRCIRTLGVVKVRVKGAITAIMIAAIIISTSDD